jgi:hypothetical protein
MAMLTIYSCYDSSQCADDELEARVSDLHTQLGGFTWMNPETKTLDWEAAYTCLYRSESSDQELQFCLVTREKPDLQELFESVHVYLLDGQFYTYEIGSADMPPELGDFPEWEPFSTKATVSDKTVIAYHTFRPVRVESFIPHIAITPPTIYVAQLAAKALAVA